MVSESFLHWSSFCAINKPALGCACIARLAPAAFTSGHLFIFRYYRPGQYLTPALPQPPYCRIHVVRVLVSPSTSVLFMHASSVIASILCGQFCLPFRHLFIFRYCQPGQYLTPALVLPPYCRIHVVEFSWALLPLSSLCTRHQWSPPPCVANSVCHSRRRRETSMSDDFIIPAAIRREMSMVFPPHKEYILIIQSMRAIRRVMTSYYRHRRETIDERIFKLLIFDPP